MIRASVPSPTTATRSPGLGWPRPMARQATAAGSARAASSRSTGAGEHVDDLGREQHLVGGGAGPGEAELVVDDAQVRVALDALGADAVRDDALGDHRLAGLQAGHARADRLDHTGPLVPGDQG